MNGPEIQRMIQLLSRLPGLGPRSGRRVALHLLKKREILLKPLIDALKEADETIKACTECYNLDTCSPCTICQDPRRDSSLLCVVADVSDLWALERSQVFRGKYHILGGLLSAIDGVGPQQLHTEQLIRRVEQGEIREIILALNATLDGQTTLHYLLEKLQKYSVKISSLAHGVPIGGELDYLDEGTLSTAFLERRGL